MLFFPPAIAALRMTTSSFMEHLYFTHREAMYRAAHGVLHHPEDTEDVVNSALLKLQEKVALLRDMDCCALRAYSVITVRNIAVSLRKRNRRPELLFGDEDYLDTLHADEIAADEQMLADARADVLRCAMEHLPLRQRDLLEAKYMLGHSDAQIAQALGVQPSSVRALLTRARRSLRDIVEEIDT